MRIKHKNHISPTLLKRLETLIKVTTPIKKPGTKKSKDSYYTLACSFDIETSSVMIDGQRQAFMYCWTFQIEDLKISGRKWEEFLKLIDLIKETLEPQSRLVIYAHNLPFEFSFFSSFFTWSKVMAHDQNHIFYGKTDNIEFRCSFALSCLSLAGVGKSLGLPKMLGDLDYSKIRHHDTPLTDKEWGYAFRDVEIVVKYIRKVIDKTGYFEDVPYTNTGYVRKDLKQACFPTKDAKNDYRRKYISPSKKSAEEFEFMIRSFMGGYTHSNPNKTGYTIQNVESQDLTSSYPTVILSELYPVGAHFNLSSDFTLAELERDTANRFSDPFPKVYLCRYAIYNVSPKEGVPDFYLSVSRLMVAENVQASNGRMAYGEYVEFQGTSIDWEIFKNCYDFTEAKILYGMGWYAEPLPEPILRQTLDYYEKKTRLKDVKGEEELYMESKGKVNAIYGCCVTNPIKPELTFDDEEGWQEEPINMKEAVKKYNRDYNRFLCYEWGIFITSYARFNVWTAIIATGKDYVYCDTDSVKFENSNNYREFFENYNDSIKKKLLYITGIYGIDESLLHPRTKKGVEKWLGVWDFDGAYALFKTLGAKKYIYSKDQEEHLDEDLGIIVNSETVYITVAGLGKIKGAEYINQLAPTAREKIELFAYGLFIPEKFTGKLLRHKTSPNSFRIQDYQKKARKVNDVGGTHLSPTTYEIGEVSLIKLAFGEQIEIWEKMFGKMEDLMNEQNEILFNKKNRK